MSRYLAFLIISALFLGQGFSAGAAMCVHRTAEAHAQALGSRDGKVAEVAQSEDNAASLMAKKAAPAGFAGPGLVALVPPSVALVTPRHDRGPTIRPIDAPKLHGISPAPPLRPPLAII